MHDDVERLVHHAAGDLQRRAALGDAVDELLGTRGIKRAGGAVGALTAGLVDRQRAYEVLLAYALAPLLAADLWAAPAAG